MKYLVISFTVLVLTLSVTLATGNNEEEKCKSGESAYDKKISCKCDVDENNKSKNIPNKVSPKCGQGKCGE
ncbi:hypothetical protein PGH07_10110 [Sulfurovum sp. zt1-1]|uniref:Uncharacterized protein n=1 Tax=Sulfurovum zhangzhouensis TaxID=3019067 RepID=A0ABT7R147_9BACT|nr:hypothetical protein [Sulfurovum zhangzhouensis]MDM5272529.1 hypothetical protein [Sulfurovum zhangzhouensis]